MGFSNFNEMIHAIKTRKNKMRCAVVAAESRHTLEAVLTASKEGLVKPILIGDEAVIRKYLQEINGNGEPVTVIPASGDDEAAQRAVDFVHAGKVDCLMKGRLETGTMMSAVLSSKNKLKTKKIVSLLAAYEIPGYHKLLYTMDGGVTLYPTLHQKKLMIESAVEVLIRLGVPCPKVAVMSALEVVNPKIHDTIEAAELKKMNEHGEIKNCIVEGPISFDCVFSKEAAKLKGYESPVSGDADLLLWPDITAGNLAGKCMYILGHATCGVSAIGTKVPMVLASRSSSAEEKYLSIVFASALAEHVGEG
jgi:phosphate butyryltransferase